MFGCSVKSSDPQPALLSRLSLGWIGFGVLLLYLFFNLFYAEGPHAQTRVIREVVDWLMVIALLLLYWQGYQRLKQEERPKGLQVLLFAMGFSLLAMGTPPFHSTDLFGYINRGWQQAHYGLNPYVFVIDDIPNWGTDPMIRDHWVNNPCPYGFLFAWLAKLLCQLGGGDWLRTATLFKGMNVLAHGLTAGLLYWGVKRMGYRRPDLALYLYAWNPLILVHHVINGHNDILMGLFTTLAMVFAIAEVWWGILPALVAATFIKYAAGILLPLAVLFLWKTEDWKKALVGIAAGVATMLLIGAPYLPDWQHFKLEDMGTNATLTHNSLPAMIFHTVEMLAPLVPGGSNLLGPVKLGIKLLVWGSFGLFFLSQLGLFLKHKTFSKQALIEKSLLLQFLLICGVSSKFYAWYIGMFFPLALLLPIGTPLRRMVLLVSGAQLFSITLIGQAHILNYLLLMGLPLLWVWRFGGQPERVESLQDPPLLSSP